MYAGFFQSSVPLENEVLCLSEISIIFFVIRGRKDLASRHFGFPAGKIQSSYKFLNHFVNSRFEVFSFKNRIIGAHKIKEPSVELY